jgi:hypothetical protein
MHPQLLTLIAAQRIVDLHRAADRDRVVHTATTATSSHAVAAPVSFLRWLPHRLPQSCNHGRLEPREDPVGDCK